MTTVHILLVFPQSCGPVSEEVCYTVQRQQCRIQEDEECETVAVQKCETVSEEVCQVTNDEQCENKEQQVFETVTELQCRVVMEEVRWQRVLWVEFLVLMMA